jgi:phospholipase/carboxylesterase
MKFTENSSAHLNYVVASPDNFNADNLYGLIILLHGYGSHMGDLSSLAPAIDQNNYIYLCPNAPIEMDVGFGQKGYAWYPISPGKEPSSDSLSESVKMLNETISSVIEEYPVDEKRVFIGGFSQGGMMTMHAGLIHPNKYKGAFILSSRMLMKEEFENKIRDTHKIPIFMSHGLTDTVISIEDGRNTQELLTSYGYEVEYREYEMAHQIIQDTITDLKNWITSLQP